MERVKRILLLVLIILIGKIQAQELPLGEGATATVLTCGPGNDFYTTFGHSALRIIDTSQGIDWVYNYGTFDFNTPHFYWKFTRGKLNYRLSREPYSLFQSVYEYERRAVWEQRLNLTPQEVNNLYVALEWNFLPENRYYQYDFFRDNCATRVRDMVEAAPAHRIVDCYDWESEGKCSYRDLLQSCLNETLEWWRLGIDLILGLPADHRCTTEESMFLPIMMQQHYETADLFNLNDLTGKRLTDGSRQLLTDTREPLRRSFPPIVIFALIFTAIAVLTWRRLWPRWADTILFILAGIIGLFLLFMWFGTDHWVTKWNLNILWASPLLILIAIRHKKSPSWALWLQEGCFVAAAAYVIICGLTPALIPIILTLAMRVAYLIPRKPQPQRRQR